MNGLHDIGVGPLRGPVVDSHATDGLAPATLVQGRHDVLAGIWFGQGRHGVLDVQEDLVGAKAEDAAEEEEQPCAEIADKAQHVERLARVWRVDLALQGYANSEHAENRDHQQGAAHPLAQ